MIHDNDDPDLTVPEGGIPSKDGLYVIYIRPYTTGKPVEFGFLCKKGAEYFSHPDNLKVPIDDATILAFIGPIPTTIRYMNK